MRRYRPAGELLRFLTLFMQLPGQGSDPELELAQLRTALVPAKKSVEISPQDSNAHIELSRIYYEIALRIKAADPTEALAAFQDSSAAAESAVQLEPRSSFAHSRARLAYHAIGQIFASRGDQELALKAYESALPHAEQAHQIKPADKLLQKIAARSNLDVRITCKGIGDRLESEKNNKAALDAYRAGIAAFEKAVKLDSGDMKIRLWLVVCLVSEYRVLDAGSPNSQSQRAAPLERAISELRRLDEQGKLEPSWAAKLRELESPRKGLSGGK